MSYAKRIRTAAKILFETCTKGGTPVSTPGTPTPAPAVTSEIFIDVINESTAATDVQLLPIVAALQKQVTNDFFPAWGVNATLSFIPKGGVADPTHWALGIFDNSDQAGALGYHDVTAAGLPLGKVFAETDIQSGSSLSVTISHECLEMLGDPDINLCVFVQSSDTAGTLYAYEVCDATEDDSLGYQIDGVLLSDFVFPAWFETFLVTAQFDQQKKCTAPLQLLPGGYIGVYQIPNTGGWTQLTAQLITKSDGTKFSELGMNHSAPEALVRREHNYLHRPRLGSRREKRRTPRNHWLPSTK